MGLPLLCLIAVCLPHPDLCHHTHPQPRRWPLANLRYSRFRVRAADSPPVGRLPRGADAAVRNAGTPLMFLKASKEGKAGECLQHLKFSEGRGGEQASREHDERALQCINKCHVKRRMWLFHSSQTAEWRHVDEQLRTDSDSFNMENNNKQKVFLKVLSKISLFLSLKLGFEFNERLSST